MTTYTTPQTQVTRTLITSTIYNQQLIGNIAHLATVHKAQLRKSTDFSHNSSGNWLPVAFDTEDQDSDGYFDSGSSTTQLTIPTGLAGNYDFKFTARWEGNATGIREFRILLNGTTVLWQETEQNPTSATFFMELVGEYELDEGDYIELEAYQNSGGTLALQSAGVRSPMLSLRWTGYVA